MSIYVPLWVKTHFSFLEGASSPDELVDQVHALGLAGLAVTDRDGVYGMVRAHSRAKEKNVRLIVGSQITLEKARVVLLAQNEKGYGNLCALITKARARCKKGEALAQLAEVLDAAPGLIAVAEEPSLFAALKEAYGDAFYALCARHQNAFEKPKERVMRNEAKRLGAPIVACNEVLYHDRARRPLQDVVTCIRHGTALQAAGALLKPNAEHTLLADSAFRTLFRDDLAAVERTIEIASRCPFSLAELRYRYPAEWVPEHHTEETWLRSLTLGGAEKRFPSGVPKDVVAQLEKELVLIEELDYGGYFLTLYDVVQFCARENILCQGRGSAANSAVCFCLGITAVDPVQMDLFFERFLSRERAEPPDIDLDIEHERREEVIQYVYKRYGRTHAAMVANIIRYRLKSAVRDVGKALGIAPAMLGTLSDLVSRRHSMDYEVIEKAAEPTNHAEAIGSPLYAHFLKLVHELLEAPRHLSIHPGGFLLGHKPITSLVPIEPATMENRTVIQWDKYDVEELGLFKVDLLGLGILSAVHRSFDLMRKYEGVDLEMAKISHDDPETFEMTARADTIGVFQIESRAQQSMLPRLKPTRFYDIVVQVAIVRPGPIQGDMVHPYLRRRAGLEEVSYPHPMLEKVLDKTLGVPIFQEQVMKLAVCVAGYSPGESDQLRRDMASWRSSGRIEKHHERFVNGVISHGIDREYAERVFAQIRGFGEYGFPESHAVSFALIAYVTAWLKCHHPAAFTCALLNSQPMGFYAPSTLVEDVKRHDIEVRPIRLNRSEWDCTLEPSKNGTLAIRMGLRYVKGWGERERQQIEREAEKRPFESLMDLERRTHLSRRALSQLAKAGGLEELSAGRREALWASRGVVAPSHNPLGIVDSDPTRRTFDRLMKREEIEWDYIASGHSSRGHPMEAYRARLKAQGIPDAKTVRMYPDGKRLRYVGLVICRQRPETASGVIFYTLEDETGFVNLVVWPKVFEQYELIAKRASPLGVTGKLQVQSGVIHLVVEKLWIPDASDGPKAGLPASRNFH